MCLFLCVKEIERQTERKTKTKSETEKWSGEGTFI